MHLVKYLRVTGHCQATPVIFSPPLSGDVRFKHEVEQVHARQGGINFRGLRKQRVAQNCPNTNTLLSDEGC